MDTAVVILGVVGIGFWVSQLINVAFTDGRYIKRPMGKLGWFIAVLLGNVIGATIFFVWKRQAITQMAEKCREAEIAVISDAYRKPKTEIAEP